MWETMKERSSNLWEALKPAPSFRGFLDGWLSGFSFGALVCLGLLAFTRLSMVQIAVGTVIVATLLNYLSITNRAR
jgi:glycerol uptake facilitator-like aquaporin